MSKASIDLTTDEPVPAPSGKKRRLSNEIDLTEAPARGPSQRIAINEVTKETRELRAKLEKAEVVEASLFSKLERMERRADTAEEKLRALRQEHQAASKKPAALPPVCVPEPVKLREGENEWAAARESIKNLRLLNYHLLMPWMRSPLWTMPRTLPPST